MPAEALVAALGIALVYTAVLMASLLHGWLRDCPTCLNRCEQRWLTDSLRRRTRHVPTAAAPAEE